MLFFFSVKYDFRNGFCNFTLCYQKKQRIHIRCFLAGLLVWRFFISNVFIDWFSQLSLQTH